MYLFKIILCMHGNFQTLKDFNRRFYKKTCEAFYKEIKTIYYMYHKFCVSMSVTSAITDK